MKIPKGAKRVYKGKIFEVWEWEQKEFDGGIKTYEMVKRPDSIQIMAVLGGKLLITREEQPPDHVREVGLLGGRGEEGEDPLQAAKRELMEETGMRSDDWELWKVYEPFAKIDHKIYFFIARNLQKKGEPQLEAGEKIEIRAVSFDEFIEKMCNGYWGGEFNADILRMRLESAKLEEFRKKLLP
ncbi:MAG: NUDIX hydrolase [Candidatus Taylorbacteria bacterium]|nr:NUDIX hydrolase [Candidatus Taylorbacteria bacterium]